MASPSQTPEGRYIVEFSSVDPIKILLFMVSLCITRNIRAALSGKQWELPSCFPLEMDTAIFCVPLHGLPEAQKTG